MKIRVALGQGKNQLAGTRPTDFWGLAGLGDRSDGCPKSTWTSHASVGAVWGKSPPSVRTWVSTGGRSGVVHFCCRNGETADFRCFSWFFAPFPSHKRATRGTCLDLSSVDILCTFASYWYRFCKLCRSPCEEINFSGVDFYSVLELQVLDLCLGSLNAVVNAGWAARELRKRLAAVSHRRGRGRGPYLVGKLTVGLGYHWHTNQPGPRVLRHT